MNCHSKSGREIISIHIGQAGVQMGNAIWELLKVEHEMDRCGNLLCYCPEPLVDHAESLFYEVRSGKFCPRCLFIDSESMVIDEIRTDSYSNNFPYFGLISGTDCASGNFGRGYNMVGKELMEPIRSALNVLIEQTNNLNGIIIYHSISGGTGSGLTARIVEFIKDTKLKVPIINFCVFPSPNLSTSIVEPYNAMLSTAANGDSADLMIFVDNEALYSLNSAQFNIHRSLYVNINRRISQIVSSLTASYRFYNKLSSDFSIFQTNLVPYPEIHYSFVAYSTFLDDCSRFTVNELTNRCFELCGQAFSVQPSDGSYMSCCMLYRGIDCNPYVINRALLSITKNTQIKFVDWCPSHFKVAINPILPGYIPCTDIPESFRSLTTLNNSTAIVKPWQNLSNRFQKLFNKKSYLHWFKQEGIEEQALTSAHTKLTELISRYQNLSSSKSPAKNVSNKNLSRILSGSSDSLSTETEMIPMLSNSETSSVQDGNEQGLNYNCFAKSTASLLLSDFTKLFKEGYQNSLISQSLQRLNYYKTDQSKSKEFLAKFMRKSFFEKSNKDHLKMGGDSDCQVCNATIQKATSQDTLNIELISNSLASFDKPKSENNDRCCSAFEIKNNYIETDKTYTIQLDNLEENEDDLTISLNDVSLSDDADDIEKIELKNNINNMATEFHQNEHSNHEFKFNYEISQNDDKNVSLFDMILNDITSNSLTKTTELKCNESMNENETMKDISLFDAALNNLTDLIHTNTNIESDKINKSMS